MSDYARRAFRVQLASVMDTLLKTAVCEIAKIFEGSLCEQQTELTQRVEEISALRGRLEKAERGLGEGGGDLDTAAQLNADAETSSQTMSSVTDDTEMDEAPDDWCAPIQWDEPVDQPSEYMEEYECPSVTLKPLSVSLWRIPNIKHEVEEDFESHLITALSSSPPHKSSGSDDRLHRLRRRLERLNSSLAASGCGYGQENRPEKLKKEALTTPITPVRRRVRKPKRKHDEELVSFSCQYCPRVFDTEFGLKVHIWSHKKCSKCHKTFPFPSLLLRHMKSSHCVKKEKDAAQEKRSNNHKVRSTKWRSCKYCSKKFRSKDLLNVHVEGEHSEPWEIEERNGDPTWTMPINDPTDQQPTTTTSSSSPRSQRTPTSSLTASGPEKRPVRLKKDTFKTPITPVRKKKESSKGDKKSSETSPRNGSKSESKDGATKARESQSKNSSKRKSYNCRYCQRVFTLKASLKKHSWSHKRCSKCHKTFPFPSLLRQHVTACHRVKTDKDSTEKKGSNNVHSKNDSDEPRGIEERNGDVDWTMPIDDPTDQQPSTSSSPKSPATLNKRGKGKRLEATGKKVPKDFKCKVCKKVLTTKMTLIEHLRIHTGEKPVVCTQCGESFRCHALVSKHRKTCQGRAATGKADARKTDAGKTDAGKTDAGKADAGKADASLKLRCKDCDRRFTTHEKLTKHRQWVHKTKLHTCKICGQGFSYVGRLSLHYEKVHA